MRKILISILLAGAAASPAWSATAADDYSDRAAERKAAREARQPAREDRTPAREERSSNREERKQAREQVREPRAPVAPSVAPDAQVQRLAPRAAQEARAQQRAAQQRVPLAGQDPRARQRPAPQRVDERRSQAAERAADVQRARDARIDRRGQRLDQSRERLQQIREARRNAPPPPISRTPQPNTQPPPPVAARPTSSPQWNTNWRNNNRYDWYNHRHRHRSLFNLGFYYDPFGWGYQPYRIGWRMWPSYFGSSYWLNDPWQYRLPYAPPGTRWIRYYDDAILVDMWSGQVVDVIYSFFW